MAGTPSWVPASPPRSQRSSCAGARSPRPRRRGSPWSSSRSQMQSADGRLAARTPPVALLPPLGLIVAGLLLGPAADPPGGQDPIAHRDADYPVEDEKADYRRDQPDHYADRYRQPRAHDPSGHSETSSLSSLSSVRRSSSQSGVSPAI